MILWVLMIVYGWRSAVLGTEPISHTCSACNGDSLTFIAYQKYAHIYWIPFFPLGKQVFLKCARCNHLVERKDMTGEEKAVIAAPLSKARTPVWSFSFCAVLAAVIGGGLALDRRAEFRTAAYHKDPRPGDLVVLRAQLDPAHPFQVVRVNKIEGESLDLSFSNYAYTTLDGAKKDIEHGVSREPSAESRTRQEDDYFGKHAAMARTTYARLDVR